MADDDTDLYETGCMYCGDDRKPRRAGACIDCTDPSDFFTDWEDEWPPANDAAQK